MKRSVILWLGFLTGCGAVEEFDKFRFVAVDAGRSTTAAVDAGSSSGPADAAADSPDSAMQGGADGGAQDAGAISPAQLCNGLGCDDLDVCTMDTCDPASGCKHRAIDDDQDGYSPGTCKASSGLRGGDCNDANPAVHPGATEVCDGIDNNCDGAIDEGLPVLRCYPDLDRDGFANLDGMARSGCMCPNGTIAVADPADRTQNDCWDDPLARGADVFPRQATFFTDGYGVNGNSRSFDYNCDGSETPEFKALPMGGCTGLIGLACGSSQGYVGTVPACGETGSYTTCGMTGMSCQSIMETRKQPCR